LPKIESRQLRPRKTFFSANPTKYFRESSDLSQYSCTRHPTLWYKSLIRCISTGPIDDETECTKDRHDLQTVDGDYLHDDATDEICNDDFSDNDEIITGITSEIDDETDNATIVSDLVAANKQKHVSKRPDDAIIYEKLVSKYVNYSDKNLDSSSLDDDEVREIRSCIKYLTAQNKEKINSSDDVDQRFVNAINAVKLLNILLRSNPRKIIPGDSDEILVSHRDFNRALTSWRRAASGLRYVPKAKRVSNARLQFDENLRWQRRNACRSLYASEQSSKLLDQMDDLARNGYPSLSPNQYSLEISLGLWSNSSGALNFMLRGEGKAVGVMGRKVPKHTQSSRPWDDYSILDEYSLLDPAKNADSILSRLSTMADLNSSEFKITAWSIRQVLLAYVQVKVAPRRFSENEEASSPRMQEELAIPSRAEELLWISVQQKIDRDFGEENDHNNSRRDSHTDIGAGLFRATISSWSHSNHPDGMHYAEGILTKMADLYENGKIRTMPTPDIFNAVLGSWARRSPMHPFDAPERCIAILKHYELISDKKHLPGSDEVEGGRDRAIDCKWSNFSIDEKAYKIAFGAFRSALHNKSMNGSEGVLKIAENAEYALSHTLKRLQSGCSDMIPIADAYQSVITCYAKAANIIAGEIEKEDEVFREAGVIGMHDEGKFNQLTEVLGRINALLIEMEAASNDYYAEIRIEAYDEALKAYANAIVVPDSEIEAHRILRRIIQLHTEEGHDDIIPNTVMFNTVITALLRRGSIDSYSESLHLLKEQERLHSDGIPSCKPSIFVYRALLAANSDNSSEASSLLERMSLIYESNVVDVLHEKSGANSVEFNEIIELWSEVDDKSKAAEWAETMLLRIANDIYEKSARCQASTLILRTKNFNSVIKAWLEAGNIHQAESILDEMERLNSHHMLRDLKPDILSFHSVMKGWIDINRVECGDRVELLLRRMVVNKLRPTVLSYKLVLDAHIKSSRRGVGISKAEKVLKLMYSKAGASERCMRPNTKLANILLQAWSQSHFEKKSIRARSLLDWMKKESSNGNIYMNPNFASYTSVMSSCVRSSRDLTEQEKKKNFQILLETFEELAKHRTIQPSRISYRIMMKGCNFLLPNNKEQQQHHINALFEHCKKTGIVDESIFTSFHQAAQEATFLHATGYESKLCSFEDLPNEWKNNNDTC